MLLIEPLEGRRLMAGMPELLADLAEGQAGSFPHEFFEFQGATYFAANGSQLWKTDGTTSGTVLVRDTGGNSDVRLTGMHIHAGILVFARFDDAGTPFNRDDDRAEIWKSDGTSQGTVQVHDFGPGSSIGFSEGAYFETASGTLFTMVHTPSFGSELWKVDLGSAGAVLVKDIRPGAAGSSPTYLFEHSGVLYFSANDGETGLELWKSDGTSAGTVLVKDINPNNSVGAYGAYGNSFPNSFVEKDGKFYFTAMTDGADGKPYTDDDHGQLWSSDGTEQGTVLVKDFGPGSSASYSHLRNVGGTLFGSVSTAGLGAELWKSDGTENGTVLVKDIRPNGDADPYSSGSGPRALTEVNGVLYFVADDGVHGDELWKSDGTSAGTVLVKDINPSNEDGTGGSYPFSLTNVNGTLYFTANDGSVGSELWKSDGTSAGTVLVSDIHATESSFPYGMTFIQGNLFFAATDEAHGDEAWVLRIGRGIDFGDAPASYKTLLADDGARHDLVNNLMLGAAADPELDGQPGKWADTDDKTAAPDDEDGLLEISRFTAGQTATFTVQVSASGKLDAWLDWNRNGVFDHPAEHLGDGTSATVQAGENIVSFAVPETATLGSTYIRFRVSTSGGLEPTGLAADGEVEDYYVAIRAADSPSDWQNPADRFDSNGDNFVTPVDALVIINTLNEVGSRQLGDSPGVPTMWYDTDGDTFVAPRDVLVVINFLNRALGEGEAAGGGALAAAPVRWDSLAVAALADQAARQNQADGDDESDDRVGGRRAGARRSGSLD